MQHMHPFYEALPSALRISCSGANRFPEHLHPQAELLYLYSGRAELVVNGRSCPMEPGDLCVCFPGVVHGYRDPDRARALMIIFSPEQLPDFSGLMARSIPGEPVLKRAELPEDLHLCMEMMKRECEGGGDERVLRGYLQVLLARSLPRLQLAGHSSAPPDVAYRILEYLSAHFTEPLTLPDLARALGVSESHLSHTFSRRFGTNFRTYVNTLRLDHARMLLENPELSITRIAYECGFESQRTFNRAFAERYGCSPSAHRRAMKPDP